MEEKDKITSEVIHYSNCWEDATVLLNALNMVEGGKYLSIASSGDNTLSLLTKDPSMILAVDASPAQIACIEIRKVLFQNLEYEEILKFLGITDGIDRHSLYASIKKYLSVESKNFWDKNPHFIQRGIIHTGKFENYFRIFRKYLLPLILSKKRCNELLTKKEKKERITFYERRLNSWRWRALFKIFFSKTVMGSMGREPEFFRYVKGDVSQQILKRTRYAITMLPTHDNPYLEYIVRGNFSHSLPHYLRKENFTTIRNNLDKLKIFRGYLSDALRSHRTIRFNGANLSDIFEYMNHHQYLKELRQVVHSSERGARLVYWNMMVPRRSPESMRDRIIPLESIEKTLLKQNRAFFYRSLVVEEVA
jgi:S-adenosylmethionine-diacylglycerol 3-amino-3-carboxypropyl transferase